jgi:dihydrofolate synthase / folylpolyglutamate synthase
MNDKSLADWLAHLETQHPITIDLGLDRITQVAQGLQLERQTAKVITVAGTNGKGSFIASLDALLRAHGKQVACYTSPHLIQFNERIVVNGEQASDEQLVQAFQQVEAARQNISLSYFEFTTLAALLIFAQADLDFILLEVGLGGRLDAVNILAPDLAVITSIGLDHQEYLGDTRELIAKEKAGILREATPLISAEADLLELLPSLNNGQRAIDLIQRDFTVQNQAATWQLSYGDKQFHHLPDNGLSINSQAAAIVACYQLLAEQTSQSLIEQVLQSLHLPGRFQKVVREDGVQIVLDVAHNPQAAQLLHQRLQAMPLPAGGKRIAVFHALQDKDRETIMRILKDDMGAWFLGELDHPRASKIEDLVAILQAQGCHMISTSKNMRQALSRALSMCKAGDQIIAFGSFFVVAELLPRVTRS